ncbi:hypothetical protein KAU09_03310 [Candidatus Parcubacteria bacterium]|nr:hypothetical protein [Candidatus Parcubacteria bacterium]
MPKRKNGLFFRCWPRLKIDKKPGMAAAASYLNQEYRPNEKIFVGSSLIYFTLKYHNQTGEPAYLYAPGSMPHYSGTALFSPQDIIIDFNQKTKPDDMVWLINITGFGNYRPRTPENWALISETGFQEARDYQGWILIQKYKVQ